MANYSLRQEASEEAALGHLDLGLPAPALGDNEGLRGRSPWPWQTCARQRWGWR